MSNQFRRAMIFCTWSGLFGVDTIQSTDAFATNGFGALSDFAEVLQKYLSDLKFCSNYHEIINAF